jgi:hypothetical protein
MLQAIQVNGHVGHDGILKLEVPLQLADQDVEAMVVVQAVAGKASAVDVNGYPVGFFEAIDQIQADDLLERPDQGISESREPVAV